MKNVPSVSVPRYQVALKLSMRVRTLVENKCRNTFCWIASARFSVLDPVPLRKIDRHTRLACNSSKCWSIVFAISYTLTNESRAKAGTSVDRSTNRSPSSLTQILFHGNGFGAGPSIFVPFCWNLLPWQGQAIMFNSGFHAEAVAVEEDLGQR